MQNTESTSMIDVEGVSRPRFNSLGQTIHSADEVIKNFWRWFGDSKMVDEKGRPVPMYIGSTNKIDEFTLEKPDTFGVQFINSEEGAKRDAGINGVLIAAYLKLGNPYEVDLDTRAPAEDAEKTEDELSYGEYYPTLPESWYTKMGLEELVYQFRDGYDGYVISGEGEVMVGVMSPRQILSLDMTPVEFMMPADVRKQIEEESSSRMA